MKPNVGVVGANRTKTDLERFCVGSVFTAKKETVTFVSIMTLVAGMTAFVFTCKCSYTRETFKVFSTRGKTLKHAYK